MPARSSALAAGLPGDALRRQVDQDQVVVGAAGDQRRSRARSARRPAPSRWPRPGARTPRNSGCAASCSATAIAAVVWLCGPPCRPGKTALSSADACSAVDMIIAPRGPRRVLCVVVVITGGVADRRGVRAAGDQPGDVRDVGDQDRPDLAGDLGERREVDRARDRGAAAEDHLRPLGQRQVAHLVQVDPAGVGPDAVLHRAEPLAGHRHRPAVGEVPAHRQRHPHHRVAGLQERQVDGEVGGRARVRLDVGVVDAEQRLGPLARASVSIGSMNCWPS